MCDELAPPTTDVGNDENIPELLEDFLGVFSFSEVVTVVFVIFIPMELLVSRVELSLYFNEPSSALVFLTPMDAIGSFNVFGGILSTKFGGKDG